ncbi:helix-turn-helix transcriptional regulator [Alishewanella sp. d11]|uniref:helix-turn-helix transcriptional regulator n=1 Tax=Alishewanella sp. d11 TaxID=3414030 RepID=UPI003BF7A584
MPSNKNNASISRQWEVLQMIPKHGKGISVSEIHDKLGANGFDVTRRTVDRDLIDLSIPFPIYCNKEGNAQYWRWMEDKTSDIPGVSVADAMILQLVEGTLKTILPDTMLQGLKDRFDLAKRKINALDGSNSKGLLADKIAVVSPALPLTPPTTPAEHYEAVQQAMTEGKQLAVVYTAIHDQVQKEYQINPLGLVQRGHITYLVATIGDYINERLFALHRFQSLTLTDTPLKTLDGFSLAKYVQSGAMQFGSGNAIKLVAKVNQHLAKILHEAPLSQDMQLSPIEEGWFELSATVIDGWQIQWWILSHSLAIEVLSPPELRQDIIAKIQGTAALYAAD